MWIQKITIQNFRNYHQQSIEFSPELTFFYGDNAQGKTNILEAIYFLSTTQSPRTNKINELILWDQSELIIEGTFQARGSMQSIGISLQKNGQKRIKINHNYLTRASDLLGIFPVIFFSPEDLEIIKKTPQGRRKFLDVLFSHTSRKYRQVLVDYNKILKQRNECLKQIALKKTELNSLTIWNEALIEYGFEVTKLRREGLDKVIPHAEKIHLELTDNKENLKLIYVNSMGQTKEEALKKLEQYQRNEIITQRTCYGPHKDDILILVNDHEAKAFASHGQQRTAMISLKMAEIQFMKDAFGETPIVLLDDILLELDSQRFSALLQSLFSKAQTIITGTEKRRFEFHEENAIQFYKVQKGSINV